MYKKICVICNKSFEHSFPQTKTCSKECRKQHHINIYGRYSFYLNIASGTVGAISELLVSADLMGRGFSIFRALSPSCFCDLIGFKNDKLYRIEVKTGYIKNNGGISCPKPRNKNFDILAIYTRRTNAIFYKDSEFKDIEI